MSRALRVLLLGAALCTAAGRPACCVADIFVSRGCCAEAVAIEQSRRACACCGREQPDRGTEAWRRGSPAHAADCACRARAPVATHPKDNQTCRATPAALATAGCVDLVAPAAPAARRADAPRPGGRAPPVPRFAPLLL